MAILYSGDDGFLIRVLATEDEIERYGPPESFTDSLEFDPETNPTIIPAISNDYNGTRLVSGVLYRNGQPVTINPPGAAYLAHQDYKANYPALPGWARTGTASQADTYITNQIFNGQTQAQVEAWIDAQITNITTANVSQINARLAAIRTVFKAAAGAVITMRGMIVITAKLLIYVRDLVIRFRRE